MENYVSRMTDELYRWFEILNQESFDGALPEPIITIQKTRKNIKGYFTLDKVWQTDEDGEPQEDSARYEICMSANWLRLEEGHPVEDLVATLQHELCHYCNAINDIKDTSGKVHNKKFKIMAEAHGLVVERDKSVGWGYTRPTDEFFDFIRDVIKPDESAFRYYRILPQPLSEEKEKKKFVAWVCPGCGKEAKGEDGMELRCGDCDMPLEPKPKGKRGRKAREDEEKDELENEEKPDLIDLFG